MSRSDRRRGGRSRNYRENEKSERNERIRSEGRGERSGKRHESRGRGAYERRQERRRSLSQINSEEIRENESAIRAFKENVVICEICGEPIDDIESAITNRGSEKPVHFDCVLKKLTESEKLSPSEKIAYIGQGKFAVLYFENPHEPKKFTIRKTIEWEARDSERGDWRNEMAGLFSQVK